MRPFYGACGLNIEDLAAINRDQDGEFILNQTTVPAGSDIYFLAQMLGKLTIAIGTPIDFTANSVILEDGQIIECDIFLKCLGSQTDTNIIPTIFGEDAQVQGLWINGDPNLFTYSDGANFAQALREVKSLLCSSYSFFVQAFVPAYTYFRDYPDELKAVLTRMNKHTSGSTSLGYLFTVLWDYIDRAKKILAERVIEECPFDLFLLECENQWKNYCRLLDPTSKKGEEFWQLIQPTLQILNHRESHIPMEVRNHHDSWGLISTFVPHRQRVLFLPGQGTNARLVKTLLDQTGWLKRSNLDFVIPDAPHEMNAFTNSEQLGKLGLDGLVEVGLYDKNARYREWRAGFNVLFEQHQTGKPIQVTETDREDWNKSLAYLKEIVERYGPFDGIAGFCEGASVASVALFLQAQGYDYGLDSIKFFIAIAPWRSPIHQEDGLFNKNQPLSIPMLQIVGENDMDVFLEAAPQFRRDFVDAGEFRHNGQHVYPMFTSNLEKKVNQLIKRSKKVETHFFQYI